MKHYKVTVIDYTGARMLMLASSPLDAVKEFIKEHPIGTEYEVDREYELKVEGPEFATYFFLNGKILDFNYESKSELEADATDMVNSKIAELLPLKVLQSLALAEEHYIEVKAEIIQFQESVKKLVNHKLFNRAVEEFINDHKAAFDQEIINIVRNALGDEFEGVNFSNDLINEKLNIASSECLDLFRNLLYDDLIKVGLIKDHTCLNENTSKKSILKTTKWDKYV